MKNLNDIGFQSQINTKKFNKPLLVTLILICIFIGIWVNQSLWPVILIAFLPFIILTIRLINKILNADVDIFSPLIGLGAILLLMYPIKALYILATKKYGPYVSLGGNYSLPLVVDKMPNYIYAAFLSSIGVGIFLLICNRKPSQGLKVNHNIMDGRLWNWEKSIIVLVISLLGAYAVIAYSIIGSGNLVTFLREGLASRHSYFYGRYFLFLIIRIFPLFSVVFIGYALEHIKQYPRSVKFFSFLCIVIVFLAGLVCVLSGNRAFIIFDLLLPVLIIWHYRIKRINIIQAILLGLLITFSSLVYIGFLRGSNIFKGYDSKRFVETAQNTISNFSHQLFAGTDLIQFDVLITVVDAFPQDEEYLYGQSFLSIISAPIPRAIYPEKPERGNWIFTKKVFPEWHNRKSGITVTYIGDFYMNFGPLGVIIGMMLLGWIVRMSYNRLTINRSLIDTIVYAVCFSQIINLLHSDIYYLVDLIFAVVVSIAMAYFSSIKVETIRVSSHVDKKILLVE